LEREFALPNGHERRRKIIKEAAIDASKGILTTLPATWKYVRIQDLYDAKILIDYADGNHGSLYPRKAEFGEEGVNFVSAKDLIDGRVNWAVCSKLNRTRADQLTKGWAQTGDVLLTHNATVGRVARVPEQTEPFLLGTSVTFYRLNKEGISPDYFYLVLRSPMWQGQLEAIMAQTTRNQVSIQKQAFFQVPVPPLAEQHRIVAKVDALMALCDRLEAALTTTYTTRTRLLEALLHEALEPAATALEAAE
jgi:type I restriction enzyme, S subunit